MKKKLCAGLLVTSMILSSSVMAFAAGESTSAAVLSGETTTVSNSSIATDQTVSADTVVDAGIINVDMPKNAKIILNPYAKEGGRQVMSTVMPFKNYGNVGIKVKLAKIEATVASQADMILVDKDTYTKTLKDVTATLNGKPTGVGPEFQNAKFGTLYLESAVLSGDWKAAYIGDKLDVAAVELSGAMVGVKQIPSSEMICVSSSKSSTWGKTYKIPVTATPLTAKDTPVIIGGLADTATKDALTTDKALLSDSIAFVRFGGALNPNVTWTEDDKVSADLVFQLQPAVVTTADSLYAKSSK